MNRSYYAPSEGFSGVDTQTGKTKRFSSHGANLQNIVMLFKKI